MNLQPINPPGDNRVFCLKCSQWTPCTEALADLEGFPFRSYYCPACAETISPAEAAQFALDAAETRQA